MDTDALVKLATVRSLTATGTARTIRLAAGLSLSEVARCIGTSPSTVFRWERGERTPRGDRALAYASLLEQLMQPRRTNRR